MWLNCFIPSSLLEPGLRRENPVATINLDIIFPAPSGTVPAPQPVVSQSFPVAKQFDRINWTVYAVNPNIKQAEIDFLLPAHKFFGSSNRFTKSLQGKGKGTIYGEVPDLGANGPVAAKYTVRGLDASNNIVAMLDPEIIVDEP